MKSLAAEVERFRDWADRHPKSFGEWETDYPDWTDLRAAARNTLAGEMLDDEVELLLYTLARDNECELILDMLREHPFNGMRVARSGITFSEPDARWQLGVFLGTQEGDEARLLLRSLVEDSNEYVRRRALLACVERDHAFAERTATSWLAAEDEYSRLAALSILEETRSQGLASAVEQLRHDPSPHVRTKVIEITKGGLGQC